MKPAIVCIALLAFAASAVAHESERNPAPPAFCTVADPGAPDWDIHDYDPVP